MPVLKRSQHALVVRQRSEHDADMENLVRRKEVVEPARCEAFWNAVCAARSKEPFHPFARPCTSADRVEVEADVMVSRFRFASEKFERGGVGQFSLRKLRTSGCKAKRHKTREVMKMELLRKKAMK